jgi:hypothetical protein
LTAVIGDRNRPQKHIQRARIVLLSAERLPVLTVEVGVSRPAVWRCQLRFAEAGVNGLLRDKTRKPGKPPLPAETVAKILALPCAEPPGEATHWTGRATARAGAGVAAADRGRACDRADGGARAGEEVCRSCTAVPAGADAGPPGHRHRPLDARVLGRHAEAELKPLWRLLRDQLLGSAKLFRRRDGGAGARSRPRQDQERLVLGDRPR